MKIETVQENYKKIQKQLQCPLCGKSGFFTKSGSFLCQKGHCFDLSKKGYVNFLPQQKPLENYDQKLFQSRSQIYADGFYTPVVAELKAILQQYFLEQTDLLLLDAGCGEGYYASELNKTYPQIVAMDIAKEAIVTAKKDGSVHWMIADLTSIPLQKNSADVILNLLTPANYSEFHRVLAEEGILIKMIPGQDYLQEIRQAVARQLHRQDYSAKPVTDYFSERITLLETRFVRYELPLTPEQRRHFLQMTPLTHGIDLTAVNFADIDRITIHLEFLIGKKNNRWKPKKAKSKNTVHKPAQKKQSAKASSKQPKPNGKTQNSKSK